MTRVVTGADQPFTLRARVLLMRRRRSHRCTADNPASDQRLGRLPMPYRRYRSMTDA
jgi:hypothetical protein